MASARILSFSGAEEQATRVNLTTTSSIVDPNTSATELVNATYDPTKGVVFVVNGGGAATLGFSSFVPGSWTRAGALWLYEVTVKDQSGNVILSESFNNWQATSAFEFVDGTTEEEDEGRGDFKGDLNWSAFSNNDPSVSAPFSNDGIYNGKGDAFASTNATSLASKGYYKVDESVDEGVVYPFDGDGPFSTQLATQFNIPEGVTSISVDVDWAYNFDPFSGENRDFFIGFKEFAVAPEKLFSFTNPNAAPALSDAAGTLDFTEGDGATVIDAALTLADTDDTNIESATVSISVGFVAAEDTLAFADTSEITGSYNVATGVLSLTGTATKAQYEAALESVTYNNSSDNPTTSNRTVSWVVNDGDDNSTAVTSTITIASVDAAPSPSPTPNPSPTPTPTPSPTPEPTPEPSPEPTPTPDPTPVDPAPQGTNIQTSDDDGDGLKEVVTALDGNIIDGNGDGIIDAEQPGVVGLRMINQGAESTDYGALETNNNLQFSEVSFLSPKNIEAEDSSLSDNTPDTFEVTTRDGQIQSIALPDGIDNSFAGLLAFTVSGLNNGDSTSATLSIPKGLGVLNPNQTAYFRFNYSTKRFEDYLDTKGNPLYSLEDNNGDGQPDSIVLQLIDGDSAWDGDGIANGSIVDPGFLGTGERIIKGSDKKDALFGNVLANTLRGKNGNDRLYGDLGNDHLYGNKKNDRLYGGENDDILNGGTGDDRLFGGRHDDTLNGGTGDDRLFGLSHDDILKGKIGNDRLRGGSGQDHLYGGTGNDKLIGGSGADRFRLSKGKDLIKDFSMDDGDQILIAGNVNLTMTQSGNNLVLSDSGKDVSTTLINIVLDELLSYQPGLIT